MIKCASCKHMCVSGFNEPCCYCSFGVNWESNNFCSNCVRQEHEICKVCLELSDKPYYMEVENYE